MTNPDRRLQSCAEDYMDEQGDHLEMIEQEHSMVLKEIASGMITPEEFELFEFLYDDQSALLKALARNDGSSVLAIIQKRFDERVESLVESRLEY